ncbi:hypothetical protein F5Y00DRAFT_265019 [Daldinia vernicosa]|uniref:uncharacterized protein n=1 Tax=Daldinia vernicosa TaxID=114800 RepID=UPI002008B1AD|nr:uncharacterized protein F5Y00DRAFT_265019 [Daldinia vernicosa]KAI0845974.1 hypothetical protein F5Y00DRAFT_265019 [Daldinia vernicosa]
MAESMDEDVGGLAGQSTNKVVKKARIKPRSKPTTRQSTGATKNVARRLFETASSSDDNIEHQSGITLPQGVDPHNRRKPQPGRIVVEGDNDDWLSYEIEKLLKRRINRQGTPTLEYLVRWKGYAPMYDQWYAREFYGAASRMSLEMVDKWELLSFFCDTSVVVLQDF